VRSWLGWPAAVWILVDALAVYRLSRLVTRDTILRPARRWLTARYEGMLVELVGCMWCVSVWLAAAVVALTWWLPYWWSFPATGLAFSAVAGWLGDRE
jgi:hypothetical protein